MAFDVRNLIGSTIKNIELDADGTATLTLNDEQELMFTAREGDANSFYQPVLGCQVKRSTVFKVR